MFLKQCSDERLGRAWVALNTWKWDDLFGAKPEGFDDEKPSVKKHEIILPLMKSIEAEFARRAVSKAWWIYGLERTEEEWRKWYHSLEIDIYDTEEPDETI